MGAAATNMAAALAVIVPAAVTVMQRSCCYQQAFNSFLSLLNQLHLQLLLSYLINSCCPCEC
jgi:hypothetical protein